MWIRPTSYKVSSAPDVADQYMMAERFDVLFASAPSYDTGWVNNNDWTSQALGTTVGGNVTHNLGKDLTELDVKVVISSDGTDDNSYEIASINLDRTTGGTNYMGYGIAQTDTNNVVIWTLPQGIEIVNEEGSRVIVDTENWYYKVVVQAKTADINMRDASKDYTNADATWSGAYWIDGKKVCRQVWNGTTGAGASSDYSLGVTVDSLVLGYILIDHSTNGWSTSDISANMGWWFSDTSQDTLRVNHNQAEIQSKAYRFIMEYTTTGGSC